MTRLVRLSSLLTLSLVALAGCGGSDSAGAGDAAAGSDATSATADAATSDAFVADGAAAADAVASDTATAKLDAAASSDAGADLSLVKVAWGATAAAYTNAALPAYIMIATKPGMAVQVNVPTMCPGGGTTLLEGPGMMDAMRRTTAMLTMTFAACNINGLVIDGKWLIKQDIVALVGGTEEYSGDLTYSGVLARTCPTAVKRIITATGTTWQGTFCGEDITKW
jgi:hypothetical protein